VSKGNIAENMGQKRNPPYPVFLGANNKYIGLLLYENIVKIIPLQKN